MPTLEDLGAAFAIIQKDTENLRILLEQLIEKKSITRQKASDWLKAAQDSVGKLRADPDLFPNGAGRSIRPNVIDPIGLVRSIVAVESGITLVQMDSSDRRVQFAYPRIQAMHFCMLHELGHPGVIGERFRDRDRGTVNSAYKRAIALNGIKPAFRNTYVRCEKEIEKQLYVERETETPAQPPP